MFFLSFYYILQFFFAIINESSSSFFSTFCFFTELLRRMLQKFYETTGSSSLCVWAFSLTFVFKLLNRKKRVAKSVVFFDCFMLWKNNFKCLKAIELKN